MNQDASLADLQAIVTVVNNPNPKGFMMRTTSLEIPTNVPLLTLSLVVGTGGATLGPS
jgi:hypothetical protein